MARSPALSERLLLASFPAECCANGGAEQFKSLRETEELPLAEELRNSSRSALTRVVRNVKRHIQSPLDQKKFSRSASIQSVLGRGNYPLSINER